MIWPQLQISPPERPASRKARRAIQQVSRHSRRASRHGGFTLIEIMVALAIFLIMLSIIFVPLNLGINLFSIGKTRANVMQAAQNTMDSIERDLSQAVFVFANEALPGVSYTVDSSGTPSPLSPYSNASATNPFGRPYVRVENAGEGACDATPPGDSDPTDYVDNTHRIEFLLPDTFDGSVDNILPRVPLRPAPYLVSYYYRRQDPTVIADPYDNPIILFRARMPYREHNGLPVLDTTNPNLVVSSARYPDPTSIVCTSNKTYTNRGSYWLNQSNQYNEPNLAPLCYTSDQGPDSGSVDAAPYEPITGAHIPVLPKGITLTARNAFKATPDFTPDTTFRCADTNGDGKIDQVNVTLVIGAYDESGADRSNRRSNDEVPQGVSDQRYRLSQTINLRNVK